MLETETLSPPRTFGNLKPWLQSHYRDLPKRLQSVAVFALHNPDVIALNTVAVISEQAGVTPSTMVRFAKSIGYQGFSDMQEVFQQSMRHVPQPYAERISSMQGPVDREHTVLSQFTQAAAESIARLEQQADEAAIKQASLQLACARTVYIAGQGRAEPVATYLYYTLVKLGLQSVVLSGMPSHMADKVRMLQEDDVLLAISFSPYTANTRELVEICLANKVKVVAMTDSTLSPIATSDDYHLEVLEEEVSGFRGLSATMCLALCLAVEAGKQKAELAS
ncbi:MAG: MurR/RpiR family transcriptional regulator [Gammaproteobacteria bacterium]|jgi:DNA-binding MurR/RpiR family transcriptional regulator|nr:MurR/RpiR family transcriptional regulator [Gammaproteobacteria bacterium]